MSETKLSVVSERHLELLRKFSAFPALTLTGGTALALQINHRVSYDLDFLVSGEVTDTLISEIRHMIKPHDVKQRMQTRTQYTAIFDQIKITVFQDQTVPNYPSVSCNGLNLVNIWPT